MNESPELICSGHCSLQRLSRHPISPRKRSSALREFANQAQDSALGSSNEKIVPATEQCAPPLK